MTDASTSTSNTTSRNQGIQTTITEIQSISTSVLFELDSKTHDTSSALTSILWHDTVEGLATVQAHYDEAYIQGSKAIS